MSDRDEIESRIRELHAARVRGDLTALCRLFSDDVEIRIKGASDGKPIEIAAHGVVEFKPWLSMMVRTFKLRDYVLKSLLVEGNSAAAHWYVDIHSKVTGQVVPTELVDLASVRNGRIASYTEFFTPR